MPGARFTVPSSSLLVHSANSFAVATVDLAFIHGNFIKLSAPHENFIEEKTGSSGRV